MSISDEVVVRSVRPDDYNYIISSWLRSFAGRSLDAQRYESIAAFYADYQPVVKDLLARSTVSVAALQEDQSVIVGWSATEGDVLHYVLTKPRWRRLGVAHILVPNVSVYSHTTLDWVRTGLGDGAKYRRYRIWPK